MRPKIMIVLAVLLALLATGASYLYLQQVVESAKDVKTAPVVVARMEIPPKTPITREMVQQVEVPAASVHPHALRKLSDVVGKVAQEQLVDGEQVLNDRVVEQGTTRAGLPYRVPPGKRAVTVAVDEVAAVGWHLQPGDHVDVLGTVEAPGNDGMVTVVVLQDVEVLAVGKELELGRDQGKGKKSEVKTVTLAVTLSEARPLVLASEEGKVRFALRNPVDRDQQPVIPFKLGDLLVTGVPAAPAAVGGK